MARIALTGAAGNVGRELLGAFEEEGHELTPFSHAENPDIEGETLDVTDPDEVLEDLDGFDVVVHLAGASSPDAEWDSVVDVNVRGTKHVFDAAVENGIDRVVFASSNHAVGMYNQSDPADPETLRLDSATPLDGETAPRPDSFYGVSKASCEALANYYADRHGVESVNVRIGWLMSEDDLRENATGVSAEKERFTRATWLSPHDCRNLLKRAATADLPHNPLTVNGVSRNDDRHHSLTGTMQAIGYQPRDDSAEVLDE
ncbi:NAD-dependent epimerase/dehydratase family protein [Candidatus Halobonum tyrrellensis]|uniref:NAD-dependent epimerase/dehydratase domain-containing protein n=1 Tax=Candidatus Halobonum tyrrellensis G22 TaxID=1324957 RepID=V4HIP8_9EURY|nr:NAD(P)-dependent oxidoreductase [Candidatus Halobonum tyrrellensis]ESP89668.1 hypothetical protein K933_02721 [Candidatus Halobonum tyrrellensis G22]